VNFIPPVGAGDTPLLKEFGASVSPGKMLDEDSLWDIGGLTLYFLNFSADTRDARHRQSRFNEQNR
jgi:hypothetical protein